MADKSSATLVISTDEQERVAKLRGAFEDQLQTWLEGVAGGVTYSPEVAGVLAESLIAPAIALFMASRGVDVSDEDETCARAEAIFQKLMVFLEAEIAS